MLSCAWKSATVPPTFISVSVIAPAGTPAAVIARLNGEFNRTLALPAIREKLIALGLEPVGGTPEQFDAHVRKEAAKWADVVKRAGIKL